MLKKLLICFMYVSLSGCSILTLPILIVDTAVGIVKLPIKAIDKTIDAINDDGDENNDDDE